MPLLLRELNMQSHMQTCKLYLTLSTIFATSADIWSVPTSKNLMSSKQQKLLTLEKHNSSNPTEQFD